MKNHRSSINQETTQPEKSQNILGHLKKQMNVNMEKHDHTSQGKRD